MVSCYGNKQDKTVPRNLVLKGRLGNPKVRKRNVTGSTNTYRLKKDVGKRLGCHAGSQEVGRCHTQKMNLSNHYNQAVEHTGKGHPDFETQSRCHQKFKTESSVLLQKGLMPSKE